jgi:hypothetical protein
MTIVAVVKHEVLRTLSVCLYSVVSYPACTAHAPYYIVICGQYGSTIICNVFS